VEGDDVMERFRFAPLASRLLVGLLSSGARSGTDVLAPEGTFTLLGDVMMAPCCWMTVAPVVAQGSAVATTGVPHGSPVAMTGPLTTPLQQGSPATTVCGCG